MLREDQHCPQHHGEYLYNLVVGLQRRSHPRFHVHKVKRNESSLKTYQAFLSYFTVLDELIAKLDSEIQVERDISKPDSSISESIEEFLQSSGFQLHDTPGVEDVILTRKFGDEHVQVSFTIADLATGEGMERDMADEDSHLFDDEVDRPLESVQSGGANTKSAMNKGRTGQGDSAAPPDRPELGDEDVDAEGGVGAGPAFPARVNVKVTRDNQKDALVIEAVAQDGEIIIDNVYYFADKAIADPQNADQEWRRKTTYAGPPFGNLDEGLQIGLEKYLEERGVNTSMALFIPDYIDFKEQKEYIRWLESKFAHHGREMQNMLTLYHRHKELSRMRVSVHICRSGCN